MYLLGWLCLLILDKLPSSVGDVHQQLTHFWSPEPYSLVPSMACVILLLCQANYCDILAGVTGLVQLAKLGPCLVEASAACWQGWVT